MTEPSTSNLRSSNSPVSGRATVSSPHLLSVLRAASETLNRRDRGIRRFIQQARDSLRGRAVGAGNRVAVHIEGHAQTGVTDALGNITDWKTSAKALGDALVAELVEACMSLQATLDAMKRAGRSSGCSGSIPAECSQQTYRLTCTNTVGPEGIEPATEGL